MAPQDRDFRIFSNARSISGHRLSGIGFSVSPMTNTDLNATIQESR